jgi:hypothetical protein
MQQQTTNNKNNNNNNNNNNMHIMNLTQSSGHAKRSYSQTTLQINMQAAVTCQSCHAAQRKPDATQCNNTPRSGGLTPRLHPAKARINRQAD